MNRLGIIQINYNCKCIGVVYYPSVLSGLRSFCWDKGALTGCGQSVQEGQQTGQSVVLLWLLKPLRKINETWEEWSEF